MREIHSFSGNHEFLSNFHTGDPFPFVLNGVTVIAQTAEHAFNAQKTKSAEQQEWVLKARTPGEAKRRGRRVTLRQGWEQGKRVEAMRLTIASKFHPESPLTKKLIKTKHANLVEGNGWHDNFWGRCFCGKRPECMGNGHNMLGELLMAHRALLKA